VDARRVAQAAAELGEERVLVVGGAGDLALDLAALGVPVSWVPADLEDRARFQLRLQAVLRLPPASVGGLVGLDHGGRRIWFLHHLGPGLDPDVAAWWAEREAGVRTGLLRHGGFEADLDRLAGLLRVRDLKGARAALLLRLRGLRAEGHALDAWLLGVPSEPGHAHPWLAAAGMERIRAAPPRDADEGGLVCVPEPERVAEGVLAAYAGRALVRAWRLSAGPAAGASPHAGPVRALVLNR